MSMTVSNFPSDNTWTASIELPDSGTAITVTGAINPSGIDGLTDTAMTGSPLTAPSPPGSGSIYWLIEVNTSTGALDILQSTSAFPSNSAGCVTIFQQTLTSSTTDPALNPTDITPDV